MASSAPPKGDTKSDKNEKKQDPIDTTELRKAMQQAAAAAAAAQNGQLHFARPVMMSGTPLLHHHQQQQHAVAAVTQVAQATPPIAGPLHMQYTPTPAMPLHILHGGTTYTTASVVPGAYFSAINKASAAPAFFRNRKLRSGKWTIEEEAYANALIDVFENGYIEEKNGSTLRGFLAKKLHCSPMRISKKFSGKGKQKREMFL